MKMDKIKFFKLLGAWDNLESHIFDVWSDLREEQGLSWDVSDIDFRAGILYHSPNAVNGTTKGRY